MTGRYKQSKKPKDDYWARPVTRFEIPVGGTYYNVSPEGPNRRGKPLPAFRAKWKRLGLPDPRTISKPPSKIKRKYTKRSI